MRHVPSSRRSRLLLLCACAALLTLGLAACGDDDDTTTAGNGDDGTTTDAPAGDDYGDAYGASDGDTGGKAEGKVVVAEDYSLTDLTVGPGEKFKLDNQGDATHTLTADDGEFDAGEVPAGSTSDPLTAPDEPGDYGFHCVIHDSMTATLTVQG